MNPIHGVILTNLLSLWSFWKVLFHRLFELYRVRLSLFVNLCDILTMDSVSLDSGRLTYGTSDGIRREQIGIKIVSVVIHTSTLERRRRARVRSRVPGQREYFSRRRPPTESPVSAFGILTRPFCKQGSPRHRADPSVSRLRERLLTKTLWERAHLLEPR